MNGRRRALGYAVALVLSVSVVAPVGATSAREKRTASGLQAVLSDLEILWQMARTFWFGMDSATSATTATRVPTAAGEPVPEDGSDSGGTGARGGANGPHGSGGGGETDGGPDYDPNG
jgi:hypothetical protein